MTGATKRDPNTILPERAPVLALPLAFFLTAMLFLAALLAVAIWQAPLLAQDYLHNTATLAVTHLFTLGFGGLIATGALYQLMPVLLYSRPLGRIPRSCTCSCRRWAPRRSYSVSCCSGLAGCRGGAAWWRQAPSCLW